MIRVLAIVATALVVALAGTSRAAAQTRYEIPPAADPWTGFYLGGHVGYGWSDKTFLDNFPTPDLALDAAPVAVGVLGGLQAGYNYQFNWLVLGFEGKFSWSDIKDSSFSCFSFGNQNCSAHPEWFGTATGRVGVALGPTLFCAKGGAAWVEDYYSNIATCNGSQPKSKGGITAACGDLFTANDLRFGWVVGLGIEYRFATNWSVWAEYDYLNFGSKSVPFTDGGKGFFTELIYQNVSMFTLGINYRFDAVTPGASNMVADASPNARKLAEERDSKVLAFAVANVSKLSFDAWVGALIAPYKDLDTSGLRVFIQGGGAYKYFRGVTPFKGVSETGDVLAGYAFEGDNYSINLLAGVNAENDTLSAFDPTNKVVGTQFGAHARGDAWINPTPKTLVYAEGEFSTAFLTYYTRGKLGYDVTNGSSIFFDPELGLIGNERFSQLRVGASITQIMFKNVQIDISAGYANDSVVGPGAYGTVELSTHF